jgi:hypothetical protein
MRNLLAIALVGAAFLGPQAAHAQNYTINWYTVAGGGGTSTGSSGTNTYAVSGTIGQPATATMTGGNYSLTGGFWSLISVVQTPGAPTLTITRSGSTQAVISWTGPATGFVLEQSGSLVQGWAASGATLTTNGTTISATVNATGGPQYFRLHNP